MIGVGDVVSQRVLTVRGPVTHRGIALALLQPQEPGEPLVLVAFATTRPSRGSRHHRPALPAELSLLGFRDSRARSAGSNLMLVLAKASTLVVLPERRVSRKRIAKIIALFGEDVPIPTVQDWA